MKTDEKIVEPKIINLKIKRWQFILIVIAIIFFFIYAIINRTNKADIEKIKKSVVKIEICDINNDVVATGSGFCLFDEHYIFTNYHVIEDAYSLRMATDGSTSANWTIEEVLAIDKENDLAILKVPAYFQPLKIENSNFFKIGDEVITIGSPMGELNTVSTGIISNIENDSRISITAPISPGSSGGVLLNSKGKVIGMTYATYNSQESQNLNYAINIKLLENLYKKLKANDGKSLVSSNDQIEKYDFTDSQKKITKEKFYDFIQKYEKKATEIWYMQDSMAFMRDEIIITPNKAYWCMNANDKVFKVYQTEYQKENNLIVLSFYNGEKQVYYGIISADTLTVYMDNKATIYAIFHKKY